MHLEHVNLTVTDLDRAIRLYSDLLGLRVRWRGVGGDGTPAAHLGDDRSYLAFFEAKAPGRFEKDYGVAGLNHFAFVVEDLDASCALLRSMGLEPTDVIDYDPGRRVYFRDPDNIEVELVEY
ncbi:MAG: VOC family protein [Phycisphaerales bacterium]|nr:VOC family protein [Phycisphaerales bacterium]